MALSPIRASIGCGYVESHSRAGDFTVERFYSCHVDIVDIADIVEMLIFLLPTQWHLISGLTGIVQRRPWGGSFLIGTISEVVAIDSRPELLHIAVLAIEPSSSSRPPIEDGSERFIMACRSCLCFLDLVLIESFSFKVFHSAGT
jgi:hypothetical protein